MTTMTGMRAPIGTTQYRQPPTYTVAAQMARLHRLGRAHSHEGVTTTYRNDREDGTAKKLKKKKKQNKKSSDVFYTPSPHNF